MLLACTAVNAFPHCTNQSLPYIGALHLTRGPTTKTGCSSTTPSFSPNLCLSQPAALLKSPLMHNSIVSFDSMMIFRPFLTTKLRCSMQRVESSHDGGECFASTSVVHLDLPYRCCNSMVGHVGTRTRRITVRKPPLFFSAHSARSLPKNFLSTLGKTIM